MWKLVLVLVIVVAIVLALPALRGRLQRGRRDLVDRGAAMAPRARDLGDQLGDQLMSGLVRRQLAALGRTFVVAAPTTQLGDLLSDAVGQAALFDPVPSREGEAQAWEYSTLGTARLAAVPTADGRTVVGCVEFDYALRSPQGGEAVGETMDRMAQALTARGLPFDTVARTFVPDASVTADGPRVASPLW